MSFILDALKKSERARQRQAGPSLFEVKVTPPRRVLPAWAVILGALLVINAVVVGWIMLGHPARRAAPAAAAVPPASRPVAPAAPATAPRAAASVSAARAMSAAAANPAAGSRAGAHMPASPPLSPPLSRPLAATAASDYAPAVEPAGPSQANANLPLYQDLVSAPGSTLPRLHLDLHVYAPDPSKRFVMINMHRLKEGDSMPDGVRVISIRPDGVVLSYESRRFLLPR